MTLRVSLQMGSFHFLSQEETVYIKTVSRHLSFQGFISP